MADLPEDFESVDTLRYRVHCHATIPQEDMRVTVSVSALVSSRDANSDQLRRRIRDALQRFIKADWGFFGIRRYSDTTGYERLELRASARVPHVENYNLEERARLASGEGLTLAEPEVNFALPADRVSEIVQQLRERILVDVQKQAEGFRRVTARDWRVGDVEFGIEALRTGARPTAKGAWRDEEIDALAGAGDGDMPTGAERIVLIAGVTLKTPAPLP